MFNSSLSFKDYVSQRLSFEADSACWHKVLKYMIILANSGEISSKTNTWPISNTECQKWAKSAKLSFSRVYISINPSRVKQNYTIHLKEMAKTIY